MPVTAKAALSTRRAIQRDDIINTVHAHGASLINRHLLLLESEDYVAEESKHEIR